MNPNIIARVKNSAMSSATVNATLSNFASSVAPDLTKKLAGFIAPEVPVGVSSGQFKAFNTSDAFRVYKTLRGLGGKRNRIEFSADDPTFYCKANGLEVALDDKEKRASGERILNLQQAKTRTLMSNIANSHESAVFTVVGAVTAEAELGKWSDPAVDPIDELDSVIEQIARDCGMMPNRGVISVATLRALRNHKAVKARFPGALRQAITVSDIAALTINPNIDLRVGAMSYETKADGQSTSSKQFFGETDVFIFIGSDNPTQDDPSFAKTFSVLPINEANIKEYRDESCASDIYANDWDIDIKVVSTIAGKRIARS